jgi:CheY-like chemotaxis protein
MRLDPLGRITDLNEAAKGGGRMRVETARQRVANLKKGRIAEPVPIQIQLCGYEVRLKDAERSSSNLLTLSVWSPEYKIGGIVNLPDILIVDDDPDMLQALQIRLKANGYDVHCAEDGIGAISEVRKHAPDLIVLDLGIPAGDGFVVLDTLKTNIDLSSIPVIVLSGRDRKANEERVLNAGAKAFLQKPVQTNEFLAVIRQALGETHQKPGVLHD